MNRDAVPSMFSDRLTRVEEAHDQLEHRVYGNGQPGDMQRILTSIDELKSNHNKMMGALAVIVVIMPVAIELAKVFLRFPK